MPGLREIAEQDLGFILEGDPNGFRWPIAVTAPDGTSNAEQMYGFSDDIAQVIDPDTGQIVSGRLATVVIRTATLQAEFPTQGLPKGISAKTSKPWIVEFNDINGTAYKFKVQATNPDRALGAVTCILEEYKS